MASPDWFFSTIAQSVAAIVGFLLAFSGVQYQLEKQRREVVTGEVRNELSKLQDEYLLVLRRIRAGFQDKLLGEISSEREQEAVEAVLYHGDTWDDIEWNDLEYPKSTEAMARINVVYLLIAELDHSPDPEKDYLLSHHEFRVMDNTLRGFLEDLGPVSQSSSPLVTELQRVLSGDGNPQYDLVFDDIDNIIAKWLRDNLDGYGPSDWSGQDLVSYSRVLYKLQEDFRPIYTKRHRTIIGWTPNARSILLVSMAILFTGVLLPLISLLFIPRSLSLDLGVTGDWLLYFYEGGILMVNAALVGHLLYNVYKNLG